MDAKVMYAVETGVESFLQSDDCSPQVRERIQREQQQEQFKGQHFHDLASILIATVSAFVAGLAANIAAVFFQKKYLSEKEAEKVAQDAAKIRSNEIRLKLGPEALKNCSLSEAEIRALGKHVRHACEKVNE